MTDPFISERPLPDRVNDWLRGIANDDQIFNLLKLSFGRVVVNRKIEDFIKLDQEVEAGRRWLARAIEMDSDWLRRTDDLGRPKKLMKFSDIPGIVKEIRKSHVKEAQYFAKITVSENDEEWFADLEGGFHLVKLKSKQALLREGGVLQNCLGDGHYDKYLATDDFIYLVLRDEQSRSHAVAEIRTADNLVWDIRGKQNVTPKLKYLAPIAKFITEREWPIVNRWNSGMVIDDLGRIHFVGDNPERLSLRGRLNIFGCVDVVLPKELSVTEFITILKSSVSEPSNRIEAGDITLEDSSGPFLAQHVVVRNVLELKPDAAFPRISETLIVDGPLQMRNNEFVRRMPSYLRVANWLQANDTRFERLGDDTQILGLVDVNGASSYGTFAIDADRNTVQAGDIVEIIGGLEGSNGRMHGDLLGKFGTLTLPVNMDGGLVEYPCDTETKSVALVGSAFRKVPQYQRFATPLDDDYVHDFGGFSFDDLVFETGEEPDSAA